MEQKLGVACMLGGPPCIVTLQSHTRLLQSLLTLACHFQDAEKGPALRGCLSDQCLLRAILETQGALESPGWLRSSSEGLGHPVRNFSLLGLSLQTKQLMWQWRQGTSRCSWWEESRQGGSQSLPRAAPNVCPALFWSLQLWRQLEEKVEFLPQGREEIISSEQVRWQLRGDMVLTLHSRGDVHRGNTQWALQ